METQHTPGPWCVVELREVWDTRGDGEPGIPLFRPDNFYRQWGRAINPGETEANARLIAAAPEMLQVLDKYADDLCEGWCEQSPDCAHFEDCAGCLARRTAWTARGAA